MQQLLPEILEVKTTNVFKFDALQKIPNTFLWIQIGRITRQTLDLKAFGSALCQKGFDKFAPVNRSPIPNDQDLPRNFP
jgi:hypothetical protein